MRTEILCMHFLVVGFNGLVPPKTKNAYREIPYAPNTPQRESKVFTIRTPHGMVRTEILLVVEVATSFLVIISPYSSNVNTF